MTQHKFIVTEEHSGERLDNYLLKQLKEMNPEEHLSRSAIQNAIRAGKVLINGTALSKTGYALRGGEEISYLEENSTKSILQPYNILLDIHYEDEDLLVINKPAGLTVHPGSGQKQETLVNALVAHLGEGCSLPGAADRPGIVHRLDKDTTGLLVCAKNDSALRFLSDQFASKTAGRKYQALVLSTPRSKRIIGKEDSGVIENSIGRDPKDRTRMAIDGIAARIARTEWKVLERMSYGILLDITLRTGRTHQIRVHMNSIQSPVIGDQTYGDFGALPQELLRAAKTFGRQALHAYRLKFKHPRTGKRMSFEAEMPDDMKKLLKAFGK